MKTVSLLCVLCPALENMFWKLDFLKFSCNSSFYIVSNCSCAGIVCSLLVNRRKKFFFIILRCGLMVSEEGCDL